MSAMLMETIRGYRMITEDQIILDNTRAYLQQTAETQATFAGDKLFPALNAAGIRLAKTPKTEDDYFKQRANIQNQISRIITGAHHFPLSWKWVWVSCLPSPYRERCIHELESLAPSTAASTQGQHTIADIAQLSKEFGEAILSVTVIAQDGKYDHNDSPQNVTSALNELYDLRDTAQAHINAIEQGTGVAVKRSGCVTYTKETLTFSE